MSVLETVTVDNVTYDIHDPKVGSGILQTTAQTLIPAVNEVKSGLTTANTNITTNTTKIGSGTLNTTAQTIIPAINELNNNAVTYSIFSGSKTIPTTSGPDARASDYSTVALTTFTLKAYEVLIFNITSSYSSTYMGLAYPKNATLNFIGNSAFSSLSNSTNYNFYNTTGNKVNGALYSTVDTTIKIVTFYDYGSVTGGYIYRII